MKMTFEITFEMEEKEYKSNSYDTRPVYNVNEMRNFLKETLGNNPYAHNPTRKMTALTVVHKRRNQ